LGNQYQSDVISPVQLFWPLSAGGISLAVLCGSDPGYRQTGSSIGAFSSVQSPGGRHTARRDDVTCSHHSAPNLRKGKKHGDL
jgi:hypothetical protein